MVKKTAGSLILCLALLFGTSAIAQMPGADPAELWNYITKTSPYTTWSYWDDHKGMLQGDEPHGSFHTVYVNELAYDSATPPLKYGAIQVKENYNQEKQLMAITVMYKVKGYNPDKGDWFWAKFSPTGMAKPFGMPKGCIGCHGANQDNDFVMVHEFK